MPDAPAPPNLPGLFFGFLTVGMYSFGGSLPWARRMVVEQRRWMTPAEFTDMLGLCQFLPGGNILNLTVGMGHRRADRCRPAAVPVHPPASPARAWRGGGAGGFGMVR
jgi:chromate transport protein ChrA